MPDAAPPAPGPAAGPADPLAPLRRRHQERAQLLSAVAAAEAALEAALAQAAAPPPAPAPRFGHRLRALFGARAVPLPGPSPAARHEAALKAWRALDFQLRALEAAVTSATADRAAVAALAPAVAPAPAGAGWEDELAAHHAAVQADRARALLPLLTESCDQLKDHHRALRALHRAAAGAVEALGRQATVQAGAAAVVDDAAIGEVVRLAGACAAEVHDRVDHWEARLRALDAEAVARQAAAAEVEALLEARHGRG